MDRGELEQHLAPQRLALVRVRVRVRVRVELGLGLGFGLGFRFGFGLGLGLANQARIEGQCVVARVVGGAALGEQEDAG